MITSFFVNCVVPAKMGDIYRAYLAKQKLDVPVSKALGTIIAERLIDLIVLMSLLLAAGAVVFRTKAPGTLLPYGVLRGVAFLAARPSSASPASSGWQRERVSDSSCSHCTSSVFISARRNSCSSPWSQRC